MSKKKATEKAKDQHKSQFMVRLPNEARPMLDELIAASRRPYTTELLVALETHYAAFKAAGGAKSG